MKKHYTRPEVEVTVLSPMDIIAVSNPGKDVDIDGEDLYN
jgi:hypothetical protein